MNADSFFLTAHQLLALELVLAFLGGLTVGALLPCECGRR